MGNFSSLPAMGRRPLANGAPFVDAAVPVSVAPAPPIPNRRAGRVAAPVLPEDALGHIASFRPIRELKSMAIDAKSSGAQGELRLLEATYSPVRQAIGNVHNLASFQQVLGSGAASGDGQAPNIAGLRRDLQALALTLLLRRIPELPAEDRQAAAMAFREVTSTLPVAHRTNELMSIERIARCSFALAAADEGEDLRLVAAYYDQTEPGSVAALERYAVRFTSVRDDVLRGANVQAMAERRGFVTDQGIRALESVAILGAAGNAARSGSQPRAVAQQYGLTSAETLVELELIAVDRLPRRGEWTRLDPRRVAADLGVELPGPIALLELRSAYVAANA